VQFSRSGLDESALFAPPPLFLNAVQTLPVHDDIYS